MIARGFKPVLWVAAVGTAALGCYMLSLQVAAERADLSRLERKIVSTQQQIRALNTELGTRGRVQQLQQWNEDVLALVAPVSGQYVQGGVSLARFEVRPPTLDDQAELRMASAETPAPAAPAAVTQAQLQRAVAVAPPAAAPLRQPAMVYRASVTLPPQPPATRLEPRPAIATARSSAQPARARAASAEAAPIRSRTETPRPAAAAARPASQPARVRTASAEAAPVRARPEAQRSRPAARKPALLDDRTMRDLGSASRAERGGTRN